jgi:hypothetical protein
LNRLKVSAPNNNFQPSRIWKFREMLKSWFAKCGPRSP